MNKVKFLLTAIALQGFAIAQTVEEVEPDSSQNQNFLKELDEIVVKSTRVGDDSPVAHENVSKEDLAKNNQGVDLPILLDQQTSVVTTSDAGAGVGYTGVRIRGSDGTRINVTVNGIPMNDPESQNVWWVNMPDIASSTSNIQLQRGVGSSTNGAGAFGASINVNTLKSNPNAYGVISTNYGSFNTIKNSVQFGTGLINDKFIFDGRLSNIQSDGYIDRATSDLKSYYVAGTYIGEKSMLKAVSFGGHEVTYQAWNGNARRNVNPDIVNTYSGADTMNDPATTFFGIPSDDLNSDSLRTYNSYTYANEVDDYQQSHYQLHYVYDINDNIKFNLAGHYTRGFGFFEQYKGEAHGGGKESFAEYNLKDIYIDSNNTITETDLIRRRWLDNHFYGVVYSAEYEKDKLRVVLGGGVNQYYGKHFGEIIWAEYASNGAKEHQYYSNTALKNDFNTYLKVDYDVNDKLKLFGDLQVRNISYTFDGAFQVNDSTYETRRQTAPLTFFNPKAGLNYVLNENQSVYGFFGIGNKEPNRNDYTQSSQNNRPKHESMTDLEIGYRFVNDKVYANANLYSMDYTNQLILTGEVNDVGAYIRSNVAKSYRRGIEISGGAKLLKNLEWRFNTTLSENKIVEYTKFVDDWDAPYDTTQDYLIETNYKNTNIAFSPNVILGTQLAYTPINSDKYGALEIALIGKYVGEQYLDNTSSSFAKLDDYFVGDFRLNYSIKNVFCKEIIFSGTVKNLLNTHYVSNGWIYRFNSDFYNPLVDDAYTNDEGDGNYNMTGLFPQAGINFFAGITLKF